MEFRENQIELISFTMIIMEYLDFIEKKSIEDLHQLMKHKICNGDWELFTNCWEPGLEKFDDLKEGIETYEDAFYKIKNKLKNSDSFSENQITDFIELCIELYKTSTGQIDFDGDEMKNKFELRSTHSNYNKLKFFQDLNEGFGKNFVFEKLYEYVAANKKIQFFIHIIKGNQKDSNVFFSKGSGKDEYMSKFKYFEDCFEESTQVMSLNYFDLLGKEALELIKTQILKVKKENLSFLIQLGTVSNQNTILLFDDMIPRRGQSNGSTLKISSNFFINGLIDSFENDLNEVFAKDDNSFNFSIVDKIEILCEPNFSIIEEVDLTKQTSDSENIEFSYSLNVKKISDEYLILNHKSLGEFDGSYKVYDFEDVLRSYNTNNKSEIDTLLRNPSWDASFNYDETPNVSFTDLTNTELTENICLDEDWDDYEQCEPKLSILYQGDFYSIDEFEEQIQEDNAEKIYDQFKITEVNATLTKVYYNGREYNSDELNELNL